MRARLNRFAPALGPRKAVQKYAADNEQYSEQKNVVDEELADADHDPRINRRPVCPPSLSMSARRGMMNVIIRPITLMNA